ncbi:MarR family winged helix-turn-helix transcriptional regulator [Streptomyces sp. S465]|uniref:MarR family winged helix-turn-helix transcriptional regulator n=1 Tax=Streptomyces sp. S465 TaxID=2979468 RepID=UPI0022A873FF|nr:MarR family transcriptional regulator [Streptomyces sp. S465]WAP59141.1 MarR family transcriptional regulator [Streptomyces sp. S465]
MTTDQDVPSGVDVAMLLRRAQLRKQVACEAALAEVGLTLPQWGMLYAVATEPDSSTHALAVFIGQSDQSAGAVVARLQRRGLIERRPGAGKAILHRITPEGDELLRRCNRTVEDVMTRLLAGLSDQARQALRTALESVAQAALPESSGSHDDLSERFGIRSATRP